MAASESQKTFDLENAVGGHDTVMLKYDYLNVLKT